MPDRRELIVNADDFGWSGSVNRGIIEAHRVGIVTSASILATGEAFEDAAGLALATPSLSVGVHLSFYRGGTVRPPELLSAIMGSDGRFLGSWRRIVARLVVGSFDLHQLEDELRAQIERVRAAGLRPTHLDSEKHLHLWPPVFEVVCGLAVEYGIPAVRVVREPFGPRSVPLGLSLLSVWDARAAGARGIVVPDATIGVTEPPTDLAALARLLRRARAPRVELVVHPGHVDEEFMRIQSTMPNRLVDSREQEWTVLTSPEARACVERSGYTLVNRGGSVSRSGRTTPDTSTAGRRARRPIA